MTILTKLLHFLTRASHPSRDVKADRAKQTEKTIERYDELLNASATQRHGRAHTIGPRELQG